MILQVNIKFSLLIVLQTTKEQEDAGYGILDFGSGSQQHAFY
ncbi:hypothetical protein SAMN05444008_11783 [Cnuella takakiae]|uniref:Uncharacterized protein n=1 Tax=Cnuella takakiae TaxID=1302690 RepID=A0A1M5GW23_9BACT|nr:hypothetical protein SAMN05444008_11783 [Cnuella takakiae]